MSESATSENRWVETFVTRPDTGNKGTLIKVRANFFKVTSFTDTIHHYDFEIIPPRAKNDEKKLLPPSKSRLVFKNWEVVAKEEGILNSGAEEIFCVFDGRKNIFTAEELDLENDTQQEFEVPIIEEDDAEPSSKSKRDIFKVKVRKVNEIDMTDLKKYLKNETKTTPHITINGMEVVLRHVLSMTQTMVGRSFYFPENKRSLSKGIELWNGYHQSIRPSNGRLLINLDTAATAFFIPGNLATRFLPEYLGRREVRSVDERSRHDLSKQLSKRVKVLLTHRGKQTHRPKQITGIRAETSNTYFFKDEQSQKEMNVTQYFLERYNIRLNYPDLPLVQLGDAAKKNYMPMEVCEIFPGQRYPYKLGPEQTAEMIKFTCKKPQERMAKINEGFDKIIGNGNLYTKAFDFKVDNKMEEIDARILPVPTVYYHPNSRDNKLVPQDGKWNLRDKMVAVGKTVKSWGVAVFCQTRQIDERGVMRFIDQLIQTSRATGLQFEQSREPIIRYVDTAHLEIKPQLEELYAMVGQANERPADLLLCILPDKGIPLYAEIKRVTDTQIGVPSQCIQMSHAIKSNAQYCANVALKINVKLGGINSYLGPEQLPFVVERPTMLMGADITHPGPGERGNSISAVVGSMDAQCSRYSASIRAQVQARTESIKTMKEMTYELLQTFKRHNGTFPERIIMYRDGVSEGEFKKVRDEEISAIRRACHEADPQLRVRITFVIVQKRHHARFFPMDRRDETKSQNLKPGTVVDTGVTSPSQFDFYLLSHGGLQGTSKPTHYQVLEDENGFNSNELQELTYRLCYLYCRATCSVSVCPPAYYAHLVAFRAKHHQVFSMSDTVSMSSSGSNTQVAFDTVKKWLENVMYFM